LVGPDELPTKQLVQWIGLGQSKFYDWRKRYDKVTEHNGWISRDWWLEDWEKQAIIEFHDQNPLAGYRRLVLIHRELKFMPVGVS
jgi:putative transposase